MTASKRKKAAAKATPEFPALRDLFSGYLHQDFQDEYGSAAKAAKAFCGDASEEEIAAVHAEWRTWRSQLGNAPATNIATSLRAMGAAWQPEGVDDLDQFGKALGLA
jgi:hypothetical protein